jgi:hypothetical protein
MKITHTVSKVFLSLIAILPAFGLLGLFPAPTRDLYHTDAAFQFIQLMMSSALYIDYMMVAVLLASVVLMWTGRELVAAFLIAPITANVIGFHLFLDGGLLNGGSVPGLVMLVTNVCLFYGNRAELRALLRV